VVTLVPDPGARCRGVAFLVDESVFSHLDHREKNGYQRHTARLSLEPRQETVSATFYVAASDNPAFLGAGSDDELAKHIAESHGPSGSNADYLLSLASALRGIDEHDEHVMGLERQLLLHYPQLHPQLNQS
ncbi:MAG: gamma-glutamylcyclotransferase, partial [Congregibacter sp.]|nr:gamma-glutamylcyclotransferase [Congregibacter sp.]